MDKESAYHVIIKRLDTDEEKGFILAPGERGMSMSVTGADSMAPVTSEGEMQYGDFLNVCVFAQNDWSGNQDYQNNLIAGPSGVKYWQPEQSYSALLPTKSYFQSRNIDAVSQAGELSLSAGSTLMVNFPDPEGNISCFQYYGGKIYVGLSSSPKIYFTDDWGTTWTLLLDLSTDFRSEFNVMEEIVDIWWDTNGDMGDTLFFVAKKTDNSAGYMLRYTEDKSPKDQVKEDNYAGAPLTSFSDTTIIKIAPSTDSGSYTSVGDSDSDTFTVCDAAGGGIAWGAGDTTQYIKVPENVFLKQLDFNIQETGGGWQNRTITAITNVGGGYDVLTLNSTIDQATFSSTDDYRIRNKVYVDDATKFYIGDSVTVNNGVDSENHNIIGIDTGTNSIYLDDSFSYDFTTGAGTYSISRSTGNGIPVEINTISPSQGIYVTIDDKVLRICYAYNGNNQAVPDNLLPPYPKCFERCIHSTGYSTSMMPSGMSSHVDIRNYVLLTTSHAYPSAVAGTALVYQKITSVQCSGIPIGGRLISSESLVVVAISGNNMYTNYYPSAADYSQYQSGNASYTATSIGINTIYPTVFQNTTGVKPNKIHQATVTANLLTAGDILIATQKVPLAADSAIYYVDGLTGTSTKPFGGDLPSSAMIKDITQDSGGNVHTIIANEGKHWMSDSNGNHTLKYTLPVFDNDETYPDSIEFWNGNVWYANPADTTCYKYDITTDTILPIFGFAVTEQTSLRFPAMLGAGSYLYVESNESQKTFRYDESTIASEGWLESSDYAGLIPAVNKNWLYAKVTTKKLLTDATATIRLQVSFDLGVNWYYLPSTLGLAWDAAPADFTNYQSGLTQAPDGISHTFFFPYGSRNARVMYRINLIKGTTEKPVVTNISLHYNIIEDKEEIYNYLFILNKSQELLDGSNDVNKHLERLAFLKEIWKDELVCEITHVDGSKIKALPFKPTNITGGGIGIFYGGYDAKYRNTDDIEYSVSLSFKTIAPFNT